MGPAGWAKKQCSEGTIKDRRTQTRALPLIPMKTVRPKHAKKTTNTRTKWRLDSVYSRMGASLRSGAGARGQGPAGQWPLPEPAPPASPRPGHRLLRNQGACLVRQSRPPPGPLQGGDTPGYPGSEGALPPRDAQGQPHPLLVAGESAIYGFHAHSGHISPMPREWWPVPAYTLPRPQLPEQSLSGRP